jgi:hypothetical protein
MNPKQFIKYTQKLDRNGLAICDGVTEPVTDLSFLITYIIYITTSIPFALAVLMYWKQIKYKIMGK